MLKNIICFPHRLGQTLKGVDKGAILYSQHLRNLVSDNNCKVTYVPCKNEPNHFFSNINQLYQANTNIPSTEFRLNIGGDHSMSLATVAYSLNQNPNCKVVWVDAHADINTYNMSESKNYHGMPLSYLAGLDRNVNFSFIERHLPLDRLLYIGLRSVDPYEQDVINKYKIQHLTCENVNQDPDYCNYLITKFLDNDPFHLSFDIDAFDPAVIPHTGTTVEDGMKLMQGTRVLQYLMRSPGLYNMDLTEINPYANIANLDNDELDKSIDQMFSVIDKSLIPLIR